MVWIVVIVSLIISAAALAYVVWPLLRPGPAAVMVEDDRLTELLGRKDAVMQGIKDLEFDYRVGKLSEEDFQQYDQRLRRQAVGFLQQIEQVAPESADLDTTMEAAIAQRRKVRLPEPVLASPASANLDAVMEAEIAARRKAKPALVAETVAAGTVATASAAPPKTAPAPVAAGGANAKPLFCTNCGNVLDPQHKFCANCGTPVATPAVAQP